MRHRRFSPLEARERLRGALLEQHEAQRVVSLGVIGVVGNQGSQRALRVVVTPSDARDVGEPDLRIGVVGPQRHRALELGDGDRDLVLRRPARADFLDRGLREPEMALGVVRLRAHVRRRDLPRHRQVADAVEPRQELEQIRVAGELRRELDQVLTGNVVVVALLRGDRTHQRVARDHAVELGRPRVRARSLRERPREQLRLGARRVTDDQIAIDRRRVREQIGVEQARDPVAARASVLGAVAVDRAARFAHRRHRAAKIAVRREGDDDDRRGGGVGVAGGAAPSCPDHVERARAVLGGLLGTMLKRVLAVGHGQ
jgi:hypothetical protein